MSEPIYSPGLEGIIAGETAVSSIAGGLNYRGFSIEELAEQAGFEEVVYLLLHGELPKPAELAALRDRLSQGSTIPPAVLASLKSIPAEASLMDCLRTGASLLAHWDPETEDNGHEANVRKAERLTAQLPALLAARHRMRLGREPIPPAPGRSLAANLLYMLSGENPSADWERAMDVSLVLYAEHEYNASTFTARVVASTLSDLHSAVTAAIGAVLKGPLHGGANEKVMEVLAEVASPERAEGWDPAALQQKRRIMGFGHRVYKTGDPRATILKPLCRKLASQTGHDGMEQMADTIETIVRQEKSLPPNLDWPSARLYHYLGLLVDLYTPLFVVSRVSGWSAHVIEQHDHNRLIRPVARYTGAAPRKWIPLSAVSLGDSCGGTDRRTAHSNSGTSGNPTDMKIYTRTGDAGETGLFGGPRVRKDADRIEAYGTVDELNAALGLARAEALTSEMDSLLARVQGELFELGAELATPDAAKHGTSTIGSLQIAALEQAIDLYEAPLAPLRQFILPGGSRGAAALHVARTVCRRAERRVVALAASETISPHLVQYLNRLGDLLFVLARAANQATGAADVPWRRA